MTIPWNRLIGARAVGDGSYQLVFPTRVLSISAPAKSIPASVRWSFLLYVFTLPFEAAELQLVSGSLTPPRIASFIFIAAAMVYYNPFSGKKSLPSVPAVMWWLLGYLAIYLLHVFFVPPGIVGPMLTRFLTFVQLIVFLWVASDLLKNNQMTRSVLLTFSAASVVLAVGMTLHLPGFSVVTIGDEGGRLTAFGSNPNSIGTLMALGVAMIIGLRLYMQSRRRIVNILLPLSTLPLLLVIVRTGSRAAVGALLIGLLVYLLANWQPKRILGSLMLALPAMAVVVYLVASSPDFMERWLQVYYEGYVTSREKITPAAIEMITERPFFGWHPIEFRRELASRLGKRGEKDAHNLYLYLFAEGGVVGASPFLVAFCLCGWVAWKARKGYLGLLPFALFVILSGITMTHSGVSHKPFWLILALTTAAASPAATRRAKQPAVLLRSQRIRRTA